jgi:hypothetical protein
MSDKCKPAPEQDFFRDSGGYLYNIDLKLTADAHSRKVVIDGEVAGMLLFHNWTFSFEPSIPRFKLRMLSQLMRAINLDTSIAYQKREDDRAVMARNARQSLTESGVNHQEMTDQEAVQAFLNQSNPG